MGDEIVFSTVSKCFAPIDRDAWNALTQGVAWADFLDASRRLLQRGAKLGEDESPASRVRLSCPLQDFLSVGEVNALFAPPSWEDVRSFAALHFTGGLPASAPPIESLYRLPGDGAEPFAPHGESRLPGSYYGESARYMRDLVRRMGMSLPPAWLSTRPKRGLTPISPGATPAPCHRCTSWGPHSSARCGRGS